MERKIFRKGDVIIEKGSHDTCAYIIESGKVEISDLVNDKKIVFGVLVKGQIFGEMGLVEDQPRSATVTAVEDLQLAELSRDSFNELFEKKPKVLLPIIRALFERLRTANKMLISKEALSEETVEHKEFGQEKNVVLSGTNETSRDALDGGEIEIDKFPFKIGREHRSGGIDVFSDNDLFLQDSSPYNVSKNHFLIDKVEGRYVVVDRGSHLGTVVNGKRIDAQSVLNIGENKIIAGQEISPFVFKLEIR
jgi:CRP/FNR family transcriptional regulator, cyclic AMP receptor protein